jgi:predicted GNAT superfamily acetyltransferase
MALAADWRAKTRRAFEHYLAQGYVVTRYVRGPESESPCNSYVLERNHET